MRTPPNLLWQPLPSARTKGSGLLHHQAVPPLPSHSQAQLGGVLGRGGLTQCGVPRHTPSQEGPPGVHLTEWGLPRGFQGLGVGHELGGRSGQGHSPLLCSKHRAPLWPRGDGSVPLTPRVSPGPGPTGLHIQAPGGSSLTPGSPRCADSAGGLGTPSWGAWALLWACWGVRPRGLNPRATPGPDTRGSQRGRHSPARWAPREQQGSGSPVATPALHREGGTCHLEPQFPLPSGR